MPKKAAAGVAAKTVAAKPGSKRTFQKAAAKPPKRVIAQRRWLPERKLR